MCNSTVTKVAFFRPRYVEDHIGRRSFFLRKRIEIESLGEQSGSMTIASPFFFVLSFAFEGRRDGREVLTDDSRRLKSFCYLVENGNDFDFRGVNVGGEED